MRAHTHTHTHTQTDIHTYIHTHTKPEEEKKENLMSLRDVRYIETKMKKKLFSV